MRQKRLVDAVLARSKTEQRRDGVYGHPGETFDLEDRTFEITSLTHDRLGDMTDDDARAEGFGDLDSYRSFMTHMHQGMEWNPDHRVWVHRFREVRQER